MLFGTAWLAQSLANGYAMFHVSVLIGLWIVWFVRSRHHAAGIAATWGLAALLLLPILLKYQTVHSSLHLSRSINEIKRFGVDLADFAAAAPDLAFWGGRLVPARPETAAFPGLTFVGLAVAGLALAWRHRGRWPSMQRWQWVLGGVAAVVAAVGLSVFVVGPWRVGGLSVRDVHKPLSIAVALVAVAFLGGRWTRDAWRERSLWAFYLLAMTAMYVLALGPEPRLIGQPVLYEPPYAWLMRLPGFDVLRVPARFIMAAGICYAVLIAMCVARVRATRWRPVLMTAIAAGLLIDGWLSIPVAAMPSGGIADWGGRGVKAVVELPLGEPEVDFGAMFRAMTHRIPIVNGVSGYLPPHYLPLAQALRDGEYRALHELTVAGPIGIAFDGRRPDAAAIERALAAAGIVVESERDGWKMAIDSHSPAHDDPLGTEMPIRSIHASLHDEDSERMLDRDVRTAWGSGASQEGGEEISIDLGSTHKVAAIEMAMGAFAFGYGKDIAVEVSNNNTEWTTCWSGPLAIPAVHAAIRAPEIVPIAIAFTPVDARYIRLRQAGSQPGIPWWIADLRVLGPP